MEAVIIQQDLDQLGGIWVEKGNPAILNSCWLILLWGHSKFSSGKDLLCQGKGGAGLLAGTGNLDFGLRQILTV